MDYLNTRLSFKIKKTLRYVRLYGLGRTLTKVKSQYHMNKEFAILPEVATPPRAGGKIGMLGCGNFAFSTIAYYVEARLPGSLRAAMDLRLNQAASLFKEYKLRYYTDNPSRVIEDPNIDLVFIASNHATHAEYAIDSIRAGKSVHIEKPHVVSWDQLARLRTAMAENPRSKVFLGFNRPRSKLFRELNTRLATQSGPLMINWFIAGHEIADDHWYFNEEEGGRILGNLCHWSDLILQMVSLDKAFPCVITPSTPKDASSDFVVSMVFADRSCATITFSAKGHTFEGVREVLNVHKENILANLTDFQSLTIEEVDRRKTSKLLFRDHGHRENILHTLECTYDDNCSGENEYYVAATASFFLTIKDAVECGRPLMLTSDLKVSEARAIPNNAP